MIKEYDEVKLFLDREVSCNHLNTTVIVDEIYTDDYNALDIRIIGKPNITDEYFQDLKRLVNTTFPNIVIEFEMIRGIIPEQTSILAYLRPIMEIRYEKIQKIKSNITV